MPAPGSEDPVQDAAISGLEALRRVLDVETTGILFFSLDGRISDCNSAFERMSGFSREGLCQITHWRELTPPEFQETTARAAVELAERGVTAPYEKQMFRPDGSRWWGLFAPTRLAGPGDGAGCVEFVIDISRQKEVEERLRISEARLRTLSDNLPNGALYQVVQSVAENATRFSYLSAGIEGLFGVKPEEAIADSFALYGAIHEDDRERLQAAETESLRTLRPFDSEFRHRRRDGEIRWAHCRSAPRQGTSGEVVWEGVILDVTERKRAEELLEQQSRVTRSITDNATTAVFLADAQGNLTFMNPAAEAMTGFRSADATGRRLHDLIHRTYADGRPLPIEDCPIWTAVFAGQRIRNHEDLFFRKNGAPFPVRCSASPIFENDRLTGIVVEAVDVTEERRVEEARRESDERFRAISEGSVTGVAESDLAGRFLFVNDRFCETVGRSRRELLGGMRMQDVSHAEDLERNLSALRRTVEEGTPFVIEKRYVRPDGAIVWVNNSVSAVRGPDGRPKRVVVASVDITDRRRAEEELRDASRRKDEFLAMLAHELRNPLAPIRSGLDLLAMDGTDPEVVDAMQQQVVHLVRLVDDLLDASRIMRGRIELRREPIELASVVKQAVQAIRPLIEAHDQRLEVSLRAETPRVDGDPVRLTQVVSNLLHNASKYSDRGARIWLTVSQDGGEAVVRIRDEGVGIEPDLLPRVFELFTQASRSIDRSQGGLGIGLTVVKNLVEMHGGSVAAHSEGPGRGSEFEVRLPVHQGARSQSAGSARSPSSTAPCRILVVDDNLPAAEMLARLLRKMGGYEIRIAEDGATALKMAVAFRADLIFLDIGLPRMDGFEVARRLRSMPDCEKTVIVALTGYGAESDRARSLDSGCDEHLVKPPGADDLHAILSHPRLPRA